MMPFPQAPVDWAVGPWAVPVDRPEGPWWPVVIYLPCARPPPAWWAPTPLRCAWDSPVARWIFPPLPLGGLPDGQPALQRPCCLVPLLERGVVWHIVLLWEDGCQPRQTSHAPAPSLAAP